MQELAGGTPIANLLTGLGIDEYVTRTDAGGARHYLTDALGSTVALADPSGVVQTQYTYEPFGTTSVSGATSANASQYTGRENDTTGLYYYRARYYDPKLGRFLSEDPIGFKGGVNFYAYVLNDPISLTDPFGLDVTVCFYGDAARGFGHVGFGLPGETGTIGFYPKNGKLYDEGAILPDQQKDKHCKKLESPSDKDECMRKCRQRRHNDPGRYRVAGRNCTDFVRDCLNECGLPAGRFQGPEPRPFFDLLPPRPKVEMIPTKR